MPKHREDIPKDLPVPSKNFVEYNGIRSIVATLDWFRLPHEFVGFALDSLRGRGVDPTTASYEAWSDLWSTWRRLQ